MKTEQEQLNEELYRLSETVIGHQVAHELRRLARRCNIMIDLAKSARTPDEERQLIAEVNRIATALKEIRQ